MLSSPEMRQLQEAAGKLDTLGRPGVAIGEHVIRRQRIATCSPVTEATGARCRGRQEVQGRNGLRYATFPRQWFRMGPAWALAAEPLLPIVAGMLSQHRLGWAFRVTGA